MQTKCREEMGRGDTGAGGEGGGRALIKETEGTMRCRMFDPLRSKRTRTRITAIVEGLGEN